MDFILNYFGTSVRRFGTPEVDLVHLFNTQMLHIFHISSKAFLILNQGGIRTKNPYHSTSRPQTWEV